MPPEVPKASLSANIPNPRFCTTLETVTRNSLRVADCAVKLTQCRTSVTSGLMPQFAGAARRQPSTRSDLRETIESSVWCKFEALLNEHRTEIKMLPLEFAPRAGVSLKGSRAEHDAGR